MTTDPTHRRGHSLTELLVLLLIVTALLSMALPSLASLRGGSHVQHSMANLMTLHSAHVTYAADHNWNQFGTWPHSLATYGKNQTEALAKWAWAQDLPYSKVARVDIGWSKCGYWYVTTYGVEIYNMFQPIGFTDEGWGNAGMGFFRVENVEAFNQYVDGRFYSTVYFAPGDGPVWDLVETLFPIPGGFHNPDTDQCGVGTNTIWLSSYARSPAALFHPDVMRSPSAGGWTDPWSIDHGLITPPLHAATYPDLKTHILEHHWIQNAPSDPCNPAWEGMGRYAGCEPYYFNAFMTSAPLTLFYDGHVRLLPNVEVWNHDQALFNMDGEGLWHRETPFGPDGYFHEFSNVNISHHILTIDGILGRDTLGPTGSALAPSASGHMRLAPFDHSSKPNSLPPGWVPGGVILAEPEP